MDLKGQIKPMKTRIISAIKGIIIPKAACSTVRSEAKACSLTQSSACRAYLRALRQAELQNWQQSGGDALASNNQCSYTGGQLHVQTVKTVGMLLLAAGLVFGDALPGRSQETLPLPGERTAANASAPTPLFDRFVNRLQGCTGMFAEWTQWFKIMKPALEELGYTPEQIKEIRAKLGAHKITLADARTFSERWLRRHGERLDPVVIYDRLPHDKTPEPVLAIK